MSDRHRLSVDISNEQYETLKHHIPHGMMKVVFQIIIDDVCDMYNRYGELFNVALLSNSLSYQTMVRRYVEEHAIERPKNSIQPVDRGRTN